MKLTLSSIILGIFTLFIGLLDKPVWANSDNKQITTVLENYIQGTSYSHPEKIAKAFYSNANLLLEKKNQPIWRVSAKDYAGWFSKNKSGMFTGRVGEILNIEISDEIATAKVEIIIPEKQQRYVDLFLLKKIENQWKIISKTAIGKPSTQHGKRILFIVSNAEFHGTSSLPVGASFSEIVNAYTEFKDAGFTVDFVSPQGGAIPLSYINTSNVTQKKYLYNADFMYALANTKAPNKIQSNNYKAVHYIGGSSAMYGVPEDLAIQKLVMDIYENHNGIISSVCHGTAGIAFLKLKSGKHLVSGKRISGYPDEYENFNKAYSKQWPFKITETVERHGGSFKYSDRNKVHVEVDGRVITGQNHLSSALVAQTMIKMIKSEHSE
jgi:putative intracellular protease/amidase